MPWERGPMEVQLMQLLLHLFRRFRSSGRRRYGEPEPMLGFKRFSRVNRAVPGTNLVAVPFGIAGSVVIMLAITLALDGMLGDQPIVVLPYWLTVGSLDDAQSILGAILGSTSTVLALIFSVTLLVFSIASNQFGPRMMPHFLSDRTMQITLGLFLATFLHSLLTFAIAGQRGDTQFVPQ